MNIQAGSLVWQHDGERHKITLTRTFDDDGEDRYCLEVTDKAQMSAAGALTFKITEQMVKSMHQVIFLRGPGAQLAALELGKAMAKMATMQRKAVRFDENPSPDRVAEA